MEDNRVNQQGLVNGYGPTGNNNLQKRNGAISTAGGGNMGANGAFKTEFGGGDDKDGGAGGASEENLFSADGLKPSLHDLDNLFEDSDSPPDGVGGSDMEVNTAVPTPPSSHKDVDSLKHLKKEGGGTNLKDPAPNLGADQLQQMFPTPPSHEHPALHSPGDHYDDIQVKSELRSPQPSHNHNHQQHLQSNNQGFHHHTTTTYNNQSNNNNSNSSDIFMSDEDELNQLLSSSQFAPLTSLYSDTQTPLTLSQDLVWKQRPPPAVDPIKGEGPSASSTANNNPPSVSTPSHGGGAANIKPGLSPISPAPALDNAPKSNAGPGSVGPPSVGPRSVGPPSLASPAPASNKIGGPASVQGSGQGGVAISSRTGPLIANSLTVNLVLSDSLLNLYRDINFNSCTMCVCCTNDGNIRGGESLLYLPDINSDEDYDCKCGYSAVMNRKLSYLAGMFLEDEREVTGIQEDVYFKKKHSLLLLDPKAASEHSEAHFNERAEVVDEVPAHLLELMQRCITLFPAEHNTLVRFARLYHRHTTANQPHQISVVEALDGAEVVWSALEVVRQSANTSSADSANSGRLEVADQVSKAGCLHKWGIMPTPGPFCTEDIVRVMKVLLPVLNSTLHSSGKGNKDTPLSVEGPLTWRQFHRMAGVTTKGNTDDGCEPLPIPTLTVGHEKEFISVSPSALSHWDALSLEPWGPPRDIAYVIVCPDNDNILSSVKGFFKQLNNTYSRLKLGKHLPIAKTIRDGILRVGGKQAAKLENESDVEDWFSFLGDTPNAEILKLYAKVCVQYLVPFLSGLTHDATLLRPPPQEGEESSLLGENKENIADPVTPEGLIGANNERKSEIDALRGDHDTLRKDHDSFVTSAERENEMSDQRNGSDDQQSRRMEMERPQQLIQLRAVSTPQGNKTFVTQKASNINELSSLELSSIANIVLYCELSSLRNGSKVDHDTISNVSGFCNPPIRDLSEEEEGDSTSDDANHGEPSVVEESRPGICGLSNLGNTCYMNSIIQTLSNIPAIAEYFKNDNYEKDVNEDNPMGMKGEVARAFGQLIKDMWSGKFKHVEPHNFKMVVGRFKQRFSDDQQQDSEEFLSYLLYWLHEDLNRIKKKPFIESSDEEGRGEVEIAKEEWENHKKKNDSVILDIFEGLQKSSVVCKECNKVSVTFDPMCYICLPLPEASGLVHQHESVNSTDAPKKTVVSLQECIDLYTSQEKLSEDDKWDCPQCKQPQQATKKLNIWMLPEVLIFSLKRFTYNGDKIDHMVQFPIEGLDMAPHVKAPGHGKAIYDLVTVSNHYGGMERGHYTAYGKNRCDGKWYCFNDSSVTEAKTEDIVTKEAYVLFYQRRSTDSPAKPAVGANLTNGVASPLSATVNGISPAVNGNMVNGTAINAEDADTADAVCNAKTPVSLLEELSVRFGMAPKFDWVQKEGADHEPTFQCSVTVGEFEETGFGQSKKKAKHSAAKAFLYRQPSAQNAGIAPPGQPIIHQNVEKRKKRKRESYSELKQQIADLQKELATARERLIKLNTKQFECEESENKKISTLRSKMADIKDLLQDF